MIHTIRINTDRISDWDTFHDLFAEVLGFPPFYGRNMNAWIDCLSYLDDVAAGMTHLAMKRGDTLLLALENAERLKRNCFEQYLGLLEAVAFVNQRAVATGGQIMVAIALA